MPGPYWFALLVLIVTAIMVALGFATDWTSVVNPEEDRDG